MEEVGSGRVPASSSSELHDAIQTYLIPSLLFNVHPLVRCQLYTVFTFGVYIMSTVFVARYPYHYAPLRSLSAILVVNTSVMELPGAGKFPDRWLRRDGAAPDSAFTELPSQSPGIYVSAIAQIAQLHQNVLSEAQRTQAAETPLAAQYDQIDLQTTMNEEHGRITGPARTQRYDQTQHLERNK